MMMICDFSQDFFFFPFFFERFGVANVFRVWEERQRDRMETAHNKYIEFFSAQTPLINAISTYHTDVCPVPKLDRRQNFTSAF